jgi:hypothetical protein
MQGPHGFIGPTPLSPLVSGRTHPPLDAVGSALQSILSQPHPPPPHVCACTPPSASQRRSWVSITHPTAHAQPDHSNPEIHINLPILKLLTTAHPQDSTNTVWRVLIGINLMHQNTVGFTGTYGLNWMRHSLAKASELPALASGVNSSRASYLECAPKP